MIALKYAGEEDYRYLLASDLTGRTQDIVQAFTWRWLVEVFVQDWKTYEGWGAKTQAAGRRGIKPKPDPELGFWIIASCCIRRNWPSSITGSLRTPWAVSSTASGWIAY